MILERLGKYVEALEVVQGPLGGEEKKNVCSSKEYSGLFPVECLYIACVACCQLPEMIRM